MKYINFVFQAMLITVAAGLLIFSRQGTPWVASILIVQAILGVWQLVSSIYAVFFRSSFHIIKRYHLLLALLYFIFLAGIHDFSIGLLTGPPWILAVFYFYITCKETFVRHRKKGSFLPHVSF
jgi:uncharacterized membrane protein